LRQILINVEPYEKRVAITYKGTLEEFHIERQDRSRLAGNIYKGIIDSVVPGIGALFVDIGTGKNGFLYIDDVAENLRKDLRKGKELIIQVVKEPIGTKGPLLTSDISLPGKYLVMMPFNDTIGISKRIEDRKVRAKIKETLERSNLPKGVGCIARTQCVEAGPRQLKLEFRYLMNLWERIKHRSERQAAPCIIYEEYDLPLRLIRDYFEQDIDKIFIDSKEEYRKVVRFANSIQSRLKRKIFYYRSRVPLYENYGIEGHIEKIFRRKIFLKSGGSIVIEQTEGLIAIDVNTGKFTGKKNPAETAFKTNMEAAREIPRQIMLRDIGGIIVIDFIDMDERSRRRDVYSELENAFKRDKAKIKILTISPIGLVEMTRQRVRKSLESVSFRECPYCSGMGRVKTPATIAIGALRNLERHLAQKRHAREAFLIAHPDVSEYLHTAFKGVLASLERKFRKKITVKTDSKLHVEDVYFE
jgi:Rne/Rng family ribonuclease